MLIKKAVLLAKKEVTYNTDPVPVAANDAVYVESVSPGPTGQKMHEQTGVKVTFGKYKQLHGTFLWQVSFDVLVKGSGSAGVAPEFGPLLEACGFDETIVASTSVTYAPLTNAIPSVTIYLYEDGKLYKMTGCRGNVSFSGEGGQAGKLSFTMTGHFAGDSDIALPSPTLDATEAPIIKSAGFTVNSYAASISKLDFDMGNEVVTPVDINASDAYGEILIVDRDVNGSIDPLDVLLATHDFMAEWEAGTEMALSTGTIGSAGNQYAISKPAISYRDFGRGDREGQRTNEMPFGAHEVSGDDQTSLAFT